MKKILLLGSGNVAKAIVDYFGKYSDIFLTIGTNDLVSGNLLKDQFPNQTRVLKLNIKNNLEAENAIENSDLVISMLPPFLHKYALEHCINLKKDFVCASYLSPELKSYKKKAMKNGITCLFEMGLDPGIDHVVTVHIIDSIRKKGGKIKRVLSLCGGLTAPEFIDNPLAYKFSWSPEGVFKAISDAFYFEKGKRIVVKKKDLLYWSKFFYVNNSLNTYFYPNRDSLKYKEIYNIPEVETLIRGTIRFKGFSEIVATFLELGYFDQQILPQNFPEILSCYDLLKHLIRNEDNYFVDNYLLTMAKKKFPQIDEKFLNRFLNGITKNEFWKTLTNKQKKERLKIILEGYEHLELFSKEKKLSKKETILSMFVEHLKIYLSLKNGDTDFVIMILDFEVELPGNIIEKIKFKLLESGDAKGHTAMSKLVGLPAAIGAKLILDGKLTKKGVFGPFDADICNLFYDEFIKQGVIKKIVRTKMVPKL